MPDAQPVMLPAVAAHTFWQAHMITQLSNSQTPDMSTAANTVTTTRNCLDCDYALTGLSGDPIICPECGLPNLEREWQDAQGSIEKQRRPFGTTPNLLLGSAFFWPWIIGPGLGSTERWIVVTLSLGMLVLSIPSIIPQSVSRKRASELGRTVVKQLVLFGLGMVLMTSITAIMWIAATLLEPNFGVWSYFTAPTIFALALCALHELAPQLFYASLLPWAAMIKLCNSYADVEHDDLPLGQLESNLSWWNKRISRATPGQHNPWFNRSLIWFLKRRHLLAIMLCLSSMIISRHNVTGWTQAVFKADTSIKLFTVRLTTAYEVSPLKHTHSLRHVLNQRKQIFEALNITHIELTGKNAFRIADKVQIRGKLSSPEHYEMLLMIIATDLLTQADPSGDDLASWFLNDLILDINVTIKGQSKRCTRELTAGELIESYRSKLPDICSEYEAANGSRLW